MKLTRREALLGLGSTAAVSGVILGTGAATSIESKRVITIDAKGDSAAFLGMEDTGTGGYVDTNGGSLRIRLNSNTGTGSGAGVNHGTVGGKLATTTLDPAFTLTNQGNGTMYVQVSHSGNATSGTDVQFIGDDRSEGTSPRDGTAGDVIATTNKLAFIDRPDASTAGVSDDAVTTKLHSGGSETTVDKAGYVTMAAGEAIDVALQIASKNTTTGTLISSATIEAYSDSTAGGLYATSV